MNKLGNSSLHTFGALFRNWRYLTPSKNKIGYIGWLGHGNLGDEVMFEAFKKMFPGLCTLPFKHSKKIEKLEGVNHSKLFKSVFLGGGTLINDRDCFYSLKTAQERYDSIFVMGAGVKDPLFWEKIDKSQNCLREWVELLNKCKYVGVRGPRSKQLLNDSGFKIAEVIGDPALFLARDTLRIKKGTTKHLGINIGIPQQKNKLWGTEENILNFIVNIAKIMLDKGWKITFLPVWNKDLCYIEEAAKRIRREISIFYKYNSIKKTMDFLETCDLFIGEKLHSVILAMCAYTPSIMLEYRPKCLDFMMSMDLERFNIRGDKLSSEQMLDLIEELTSNKEHFQKIIFQKVNYYKNLQSERAKLILNSILKINYQS